MTSENLSRAFETSSPAAAAALAALSAFLMLPPACGAVTPGHPYMQSSAAAYSGPGRDNLNISTAEEAPSKFERDQKLEISGKEAGITKQPEHPSAFGTTADYMESADLVSKTLLFPAAGSTEINGNEKDFLHMRRFLYENRNDNGRRLLCYRHYEFLQQQEDGRIVLPYEVPVCSGRGISEFSDKFKAVASSERFADGSSLSFIAVPPLSEDGFCTIESGTYRTADNLYTVTTPAGRFENCRMFCLCGPDKRLQEGSYMSFCAPGLGEILSLGYVPQSGDFRIQSIMIAFQTAKDRTFSRVPLNMVMEAYMPAPSLKSKAVSVPMPEELRNLGKDNRTFMYYEFDKTEIGAVKRIWKRNDVLVNQKKPEKSLALRDSISGIDYVDAESQSIIRCYAEKGDSISALLVPPLESCDQIYPYAGLFYKLDSKAYNLQTESGVLNGCLRVTCCDNKEFTLNEHSYRAYYAPGLGEIEREFYNPKTEKFEPYSVLNFVKHSEPAGSKKAADADGTQTSSERPAADEGASSHK